MARYSEPWQKKPLVRPVRRLQDVCVVLTFCGRSSNLFLVRVRGGPFGKGQVYWQAAYIPLLSLGEAIEQACLWARENAVEVHT
jgi:hypothetical protein